MHIKNSFSGCLKSTGESRCGGSRIRPTILGCAALASAVSQQGDQRGYLYRAGAVPRQKLQKIHGATPSLSSNRIMGGRHALRRFRLHGPVFRGTTLPFEWHGRGQNGVAGPASSDHIRSYGYWWSLPLAGAGYAVEDKIRRESAEAVKTPVADHFGKSST